MLASSKRPLQRFDGGRQIPPGCIAFWIFQLLALYAPLT